VLGLKPDLRQKMAVMLCLLLVLFMTAEAGHMHQTAQSSCAWCSSAHVLAVAGPAAPCTSLINTGEAIALSVRTEKSLLLIPFQLIRPPPAPFEYRTYMHDI
jgi:hypothetical protein